MRTLKDLCTFTHNCCDKNDDIELTSLQTDSRLCKENSVFVAIKGTHVNGCDYLLKAQQNGACVAIVDEDNKPTSLQLDGVKIPILYRQSSQSLASIAAWFYDYPSKKLKLIGITGTNGKSTITTIIAQWLGFILNGKVGLLGTLGYGFLPNLNKSANTTLDAVNLQRVLAYMVDEGAKYAAMEVSSIGVCEGRVDDCNFYAAGFTNLTRDHLDYHKTMENYAKAKESFLSMADSSMITINIDDSCGSKFADEFLGCTAVSLKKKSDMKEQFARYVCVEDVLYKEDGMKIKFDTYKGKGVLDCNLLGTFNVENLAVALGVLLSLKVPFEKLMAQGSKLKPVKGRMECFNGENKPHLVVDYAHTPDGVEQVLRGVRVHHKDGKIWCILGCGGDRDKGKRPIMAIKACVYADNVIFTSDNPRSEDPNSIIDDMIKGVENAHNYKCIVDRVKAIKYAFKHASVGDCIVIAGKGHEDYQIFKEGTVSYSDRKLAASLAGVDCD